MRNKIKLSPVRIKNRMGNVLFGVIYKPIQGDNTRTLVLINPGIKSRVGPHRLYIKIARLVVNYGISVFRFDCTGLGDSDGKIKQENIRDFYAAVKEGELVNDVLDSLEWLYNKHNYSKFILGGLCGGAITALIAAEKDRRVEGVIALGLPVTNEENKKNTIESLTDTYIENYKKKLFNKSFWKLNLLTKIHTYKMIFLVLKKSIKKKLNLKKLFFPNFYSKSISVTRDLEFLDKSINNRVIVGLISNKKCKKLLIYGENDELYWDFKEKLYNNNIYFFDRERYNIKVHVIKKANHLFTLKEWQNEMFCEVSQWLKSNYS